METQLAITDRKFSMVSKKDNVIAGIVTFNPDIKRLKSNINAIINQVSNIVIVDNGSMNIEKIEQLIVPNIFFIKWNENRGIASALRAIMDFAITQKYLWVLTIDQDSIVQEGLIEEYLKYANRNDCTNIGMFTSLIKDRNFKDKKHEIQKKDIEIVDSCITSAAFCSVEKYKKIKGYDESFFIDCVDFDICYQLRDAGFDVCRINYTGLLHEVGHGENRRFLFWSIVVYHHNAKRIYTLSRNMMYLWKKHPKIYGLHRLIKKESALLTRIVIYEDKKKEKLKYFIKGVRAGLK